MAKTENDAELRSLAREFATQFPGSAPFEAHPGDEYDEAAWRVVSTELGLQAITIAEEAGGAGQSLREAAVFAEEFGRTLAAVPLLSTGFLIPACLTALAPDAVADESLGQIAAGEVTAALAVNSAKPMASKAPGGLAATRDATGGWTVTGKVNNVLDGAIAVLLVVIADTDDGPRFFRIDAGSPSVVATPLATMDLLRQTADVTLNGAEAKPMGTAADATTALSRGIRAGTAMLVSEQAGAAEGVLAHAVSYAKLRVQFGRTIGSFQAIKHLIADTHVQVELATAAARAAVDAVVDDPDGADVALGIAKIVCSKALLTASLNAIQIHGGIGVTWEHPCHWYLRRAKSSAQLFGSVADHRAIVASQAFA